jgi:hypothetical protein
LELARPFYPYEDPSGNREAIDVVTDVGREGVRAAERQVEHGRHDRGQAGALVEVGRLVAGEDGGGGAGRAPSRRRPVASDEYPART